MAHYAQTNIQFFNQLRSLEYSVADLVLVRNSYELAMELFAGRFRPSGKPFLCHLVGTASILAALKVPSALVAAALLHAAYTQGNFAAADCGMSEAKRRRVRAVVGDEVEKLVASYGKLVWSEKTVPEICETLDRMSNKDRDMLLLRLANELEDHLDFGALHCANAESRRKHIKSYLHLCVRMAERLEQTALAEALERAFSETLAAEIPAFLRSGRRQSFVPATFSWRRWLSGKP